MNPDPKLTVLVPRDLSNRTSIWGLGCLGWIGLGLLVGFGTQRGKEGFDVMEKQNRHGLKERGDGYREQIDSQLAESFLLCRNKKNLWAELLP